MAHPAYSLLVVERIDPITEAVTRFTYMFSNVRNARIAFRQEAGDANTRVQLFEQPKPNRFKRQDSIPLPTNLDTWD